MALTYLDDIIEHHRARAARDERRWEERLDHVPVGATAFASSLRRGTGDVAVIAEIKRRSPSKGWLAPDLDVVRVAQSYEAGGAAALSVLTDEAHFGGSLNDLRTARASCSLPLLRKDFTVSENDVLDAADAGAGAVLLIVAALGDEELRSFLRVAHEVGLDALVEVHDEDEVARAAGLGATLIGVNQRDLRTFEVDPARAASLVTSLPADCVSVCESGLSTTADVQRAADAGFDAVLVGEAFVRADRPQGVVEAFASVRRRS